MALRLAAHKQKTAEGHTSHGLQSLIDSLPHCRLDILIWQPRLSQQISLREKSSNKTGDLLLLAIKYFIHIGVSCTNVIVEKLPASSLVHWGLIALALKFGVHSDQPRVQADWDCLMGATARDAQLWCYCREAGKRTGRALAERWLQLRFQDFKARSCPCFFGPFLIWIFTKKSLVFIRLSQPEKT